MNETQVQLMGEYGVLVLPEEINHGAYELVVEALHYARTCGQEQVVLYCAGLGGEVNSALAIVDLIQAHGNVIGLLPGQADSSHAYVWLGCRERYVYPYASMGLHETKFVFYDKHVVEKKFAQNYLDSATSYNGRIAELLDQASDDAYSKREWSRVMNDIGASGLQNYNAGELILMGIAKAIADYKTPTTTPPQTPPHSDGEGLQNTDRASPVPTGMMDKAAEVLASVGRMDAPLQGDAWQSASTGQSGVMYELQDYEADAQKRVATDGEQDEPVLSQQELYQQVYSGTMVAFVNKYGRPPVDNEWGEYLKSLVGD